MLLDKPDWVNHEGKPLFSLDVDSEGQRLVTCGEDSKIKVWALGPILHERMELDSSCPRLLASLSDHTAPVNVVRFSPGGRMLASGSDDQLVLLHKLTAGVSSRTFGSSDGPNVENWKVSHMLRGHSNNVSDLAWSPDGALLASASVDNLVMIWEAASARRVTTLEGHRGFVKGVAWDPQTVFLASQGDDAVMIWRVSDWQCVKRVDDVMQHSLSIAFHARLSWSPCGRYLGIPNININSMNALGLMERHSWDCEMRLFGHSSPVLASRFNPQLRVMPGKDEAEAVVCLCSMDKSCSVWSQSKILLALQGGTFTGSVFDAVWTPDGQRLLCCSKDGSIAVCTFQDKELGTPLTEGEFRELTAELYGDPRLRTAQLPESVEMMEMEELGRSAPALTPDPREAALQRRLAASTAPVQAGPQALTSVATVQTLMPPPPPPAKSSIPQPLHQPPPGPQPSTSNAPQPPTAPGPRRVIPSTSSQAPLQPLNTHISASNGPTSSAPSTSGSSVPPSAQRPVAAATQRVPSPALVPGKDPLAPSGLNPSRPPLQPTPGSGSASGAGAKRVLPVPTGTVIAAAVSHLPTSAQANGHVANGGGLEFTQAYVVPPAEPQPKLSVKLGEVEVPGSENIKEEMRFEVANHCHDVRGRTYARVGVVCGGRLLWQEYIVGAVLLAAGSTQFSAVATAEGELHVFSRAGRRVLAPLILPGVPSRLVASAPSRLCVLTARGELRVWDVSAPRCELEANVRELLEKGRSIVLLRLTAAGLPILTTSCHTSFTYSTDMRAWTRLIDTASPSASHQSILSRRDTELEKVQAEAASASGIGGVVAAAMHTPREIMACHERADLELSLAAAALLQSPRDWKRALLMYARKLAQDADEVRLRELMEELRGPLRWTPDSGHTWQPSILGMDKRELLKRSVFQEIRSYRPVIRLLTEFISDFKEMEKMQQEDVDNPFQLMLENGSNVRGGATHAMQLP